MTVIDPSIRQWHNMFYRGWPPFYYKKSMHHIFTIQWIYMSENWSSQKNGSFKVSNALIRKESNQRERERERERESFILKDLLMVAT